MLGGAIRSVALERVWMGYVRMCRGMSEKIKIQGDARLCRKKSKSLAAAPAGDMTHDASNVMSLLFLPVGGVPNLGLQ